MAALALDGGRMIKNLILSVILLALVIFTCTKLSNYSWDITQNRANSLAASSQKLLEAIEAPLNITIYSPSVEVLSLYSNVLDLYKKNSQFIFSKLQNGIIEPGLAGKLKVFTDHVIVVNYKNVEHAIDIQNDKIAETQISSLIQQTINQNNNWLAFLTGHQELDPLSSDDFGISRFAQLFENQGMRVATVNLTEQQFIPQNTSLVIVANPQQALLPLEEDILHKYVKEGGNIIWFTEPASDVTAFVAEEFGIKPSKGVAIDPNSKQLGSPHPALKILTKYLDHAITTDITSATIMPWSGHLQILFEANNWQQTPFLTTADTTWTYTGPATSDIEHLAKFKEHTGPLNIGVALTRESDAKTLQRALVLADSTFIINKYLPLYANAQLAASIVNWTQSNREIFIHNTPPPKDLSYQPSKTDRILYQYIFTIIIPLVLIACGYVVAKPTRRTITIK